MRQIVRRLSLAAAIIAAGAALPAPASAATTVAYLDGKEVWVANTDGSGKTRLSAGEGDWTAVSQNPQGWIVGVQLEAGKIADLSRFTVWNPQGTIQHRGPLARGAAGPSYAYPLGLNITASGGAIVYGYSAYTYAFPVGSLQKGFYYLPSSTVVTPALGPLSIGSAQYVALTAGDRVVGTISDRAIGAQTPDSSSSSTFVPWIGFGEGQPMSYATIDASDNGTIVVAAVNEATGGGQPDLQRINVTRTEGTGLPYVDDCFVGIPPADKPEYPTVSPAGDLIAWSSQGGVRLTAVPNLRASGPPTCELTAPISTISATGSYPSLGGFDLNGFLARLAGPAPTPAPTPVATPVPGGPGGTTAPAFTLKVTGAAPKLSTGTTATVKFTPSATGTATATITVDPKTVGQKGKTPITIASGTGKATAGKSTSVKVKPSKKGKTLRKKLTKGKKAKLSVKINTVTTTVDIKLG